MKQLFSILLLVTITATAYAEKATTLQQKQSLKTEATATRNKLIL